MMIIMKMNKDKSLISSSSTSRRRRRRRRRTISRQDGLLRLLPKLRLLLLLMLLLQLAGLLLVATILPSNSNSAVTAFSLSFPLFPSPPPPSSSRIPRERVWSVRRRHTTRSHHHRHHPSTQQHHHTSTATITGPKAATGTAVRGLYIHVPYCRQRCHYCDFAIVPIGRRDRDNIGIDNRQQGGGGSATATATGTGTGTTQRKDDGFRRMDFQYTDAVCTELRQIGNDNDNDNDNGNTDKIPINSLYFGGGTPSLMPLESIERILEHAVGGNSDTDSPFALLPRAEITIEMDPGTFDRQKLYALKQLGINRISLGVQSFDDSILTAMGRTHRRQDVYQAVEDIQAVFGSNSANYSIDLISGAVPGLTPIEWMLTLQEALTQLPMQPNHISIYDLQIEDGTKFAKLYGGLQQQRDGGEDSGDDYDGDDDEDTTKSENTASLLPTEDDCAFMYKYTAGYLKAKGYEHYEVSSYALLTGEEDSEKKENGSSGVEDNEHRRIGHPSPYRSRHNQIYWGYDTEWYAVGLGASSYVDGQTLKRPRAMSDYIQWVTNEDDDVRDGQYLLAQQQKEADDDVQQNGASSTTSAKNIDDGSDDDCSEDDERLADILLKRLRTSDGLDLDWISAQYGADTVSKILKGCELGFELGLVIDVVIEELVDEEDDDDGGCNTDVLGDIVETTGKHNGNGDGHNDNRRMLKLKDPDGFLYSNYIISEIYAELGLL